MRFDLKLMGALHLCTCSTWVHNMVVLVKAKRKPLAMVSDSQSLEVK